MKAQTERTKDSHGWIGTETINTRFGDSYHTRPHEHRGLIRAFASIFVFKVWYRHDAV